IAAALAVTLSAAAAWAPLLSTRGGSPAMLPPGLEVFSDTACPHAYLAEAKFHRACSMLKAAHARFEPKWYGMAF
ncbi:unnamed protein product, partial [Polarella glacialis]